MADSMKWSNTSFRFGNKAVACEPPVAYESFQLLVMATTRMPLDRSRRMLCTAVDPQPPPLRSTTRTLEHACVQYNSHAPSILRSLMSAREMQRRCA